MIKSGLVVKVSTGRGIEYALNMSLEQQAADLRITERIKS